jgi:large subunit ribosomal protein L22
VAASIRGLDWAKVWPADLPIGTRSMSAVAVRHRQRRGNHQLDVDRLYVKEASVGKTFSIKRFHARARGRASRVEKPFSNLTVVVREREEKA